MFPRLPAFLLGLGVALVSCAGSSPVGGPDAGAAGAAPDATGGAGSGGPGGSSTAGGAGAAGQDSAAGAAGHDSSAGAAGQDSAAGAAGQGSSAGAAGTGPVCSSPPSTGSFTFHVHNNSGSMMFWREGYALPMPLSLDTPDGALPAFPGLVAPCGFTCEQIYGGSQVPGSCDHGPPNFAGSNPDETVDVVWSRGGYGLHIIEAGCSAQWAGDSCAVGFVVAPTSAQTGSVEICENVLAATCLNPRQVTFTVDTTRAESTIELN
jgi:hypothetical protein